MQVKYVKCDTFWLMNLYGHGGEGAGLRAEGREMYGLAIIT